MPAAMRLPARIRTLLDAKCSGIKLTPSESQRIHEGAHQQQADTGIAGHENLKAFAAIRHFSLFESKIKAAHAEALVVLEACHTWDRLRDIPPYVDSLLEPFVKEMSGKATELIGTTPYTPETRNIPAMYAGLKKDFEYRAELAIRVKRKDFALTTVWIPVIGLIIDRLFQLFPRGVD